MGASEGAVISLSPAGQIGGEHCVTHMQLEELNNALRTDAHDHVTVVAATGDSGAAGEPCALIDALSAPESMQQLHPTKRSFRRSLPQDPLVLGAEAALTLSANHTTGSWIGGTTWGLPDGSPGTGFQARQAGLQPSLATRAPYQNAVRRIRSMRGSTQRRSRRQPEPRQRSPGRHKQLRRWLHDQ